MECVPKMEPPEDCCPNELQYFHTLISAQDIKQEIPQIPETCWKERWPTTEHDETDIRSSDDNHSSIVEFARLGYVASRNLAKLSKLVTEENNIPCRIQGDDKIKGLTKQGMNNAGYKGFKVQKILMRKYLARKSVFGDMTRPAEMSQNVLHISGIDRDCPKNKESIATNRHLSGRKVVANPKTADSPPPAILQDKIVGHLSIQASDADHEKRKRRVVAIVKVPKTTGAKASKSSTLVSHLTCKENGHLSERKVVANRKTANPPAILQDKIVGRQSIRANDTDNNKKAKRSVVAIVKVPTTTGAKPPKSSTIVSRLIYKENGHLFERKGFANSKTANPQAVLRRKTKRCQNIGANDTDNKKRKRNVVAIVKVPKNTGANPTKSNTIVSRLSCKENGHLFERKVVAYPKTANPRAVLRHKIIGCRNIGASDADKRKTKRRFVAITKSGETAIVRPIGRSTIVRHQNYKVKKIYKCRICADQFAGVYGLEKHFTLLHPRSDPFVCGACGYLCKTALEFQTHRIRHLTGMSAFSKCWLCNEGFPNRLAVREHIEFCHPGRKMFACEVCAMEFWIRDTLINHVKRHTGEKPHVCEVCGKGFIVKCALSRHLLVHSGEKNHECETCGQKFALKQTLKNHLRIHTMEKPYSCTICKKRFSSSGRLYYHKMVHTGLKKHPCPLCGKCFTRNEHMKRHLLVHTDKTPFACERCENSFRTKYTLMRHCQKCGRRRKKKTGGSPKITIVVHD